MAWTSLIQVYLFVNVIVTASCSVVSRLEADMQDMKAEIACLKSKIQDKPKSIYCQMQLHRTHVYRPGDRIVFTHTVANVGNTYDIHHGYFEAPRDGTYLFSVTLCTAWANWLEFRIIQDGKVIGEGISGDSKWVTCAPIMVVTQMKKGSKVWIQADKTEGGTITSLHGIPSFTAVLLNN